MIRLFARVVAYGFPSLLLILGFSAWTGGTLATEILGTSNATALIGLGLMALGVIIYLAELLIFR